MAHKKYTFRFLSYSLLGLLPIFLTSCKKDFEVPPPTASLRIANVIPGIVGLYTSFQGVKPLEYYQSSAGLLYGNSNANPNYINRPAGECQLALYRPVDTLNPSNPFIQLNLRLSPNSYYSLFLTGTEQAPDTLFLKEQFDPIVDSSTGIRFINLSPGSETMTVNLIAQLDTTKVVDLSYKAVSDFKIYPAHSKVSNYKFQIINKSTGKEMLTYTTSAINANSSMPGAPKNLWLFNRATLMITGLPGGTGSSAMRVELINHI